jgi:TolA-binding protein
MRKADFTVFGLTASLLPMVLMAPAALGAPSKAKALEQRAVEQLAKSWGAFFKGKHQEAATLATPLLRLTSRQHQWLVLEAAHVQARAFWAHGSPSSRVKARRIWQRLKRMSTRNSVQVRQKIVAALEREAPGDAAKLREAIGILEPIVQARAEDTSTPEAALDLARLYVKVRRFDEAEKTLKAMPPWINKRLLLETPKPLGGPFLAAVKAALQRLKFQRDAGRAEFEAAEKLRAAKKWSAAALAYKAVARKFPDTDYAPRSELLIGHCYVALRRYSQAVRQWEAFIQASPSGPWRGQAQVELIDLHLEQNLDLARASRSANVARNSLPAALADKTASDSWKAVAFDVHLRIGIVAFARGQNAAAAAALKDALASGAAKGRRRKNTLSGAVREGLQRLILVAQAGLPLLPPTVRGSSDKPSRATTALAMAMIYQLARRPENARAMLARLLPAPLRPKDHAAARPIDGATGEQIAFAAYCLARMEADPKRSETARKLAAAARKTAPKAPWHDATMFLLATLAEREAKARFGKAIRVKDPKTGKSKPAGELTPSDRKELGAAEARRLAGFLKARLAALPYWRELVNGFPKSPYVEPAAYNAGCLLYETGQFKDAAALLQQFLHAYPTSPFAGEAYVMLIDVALERMFDLKLSQEVAAHAAVWAKRVAARSSPREKPPLAAWRPTFRQPSADAVKAASYDCYLRSGLVAYLSGDKSQAVVMFREARTIEVRRAYRVVSGKIPSGIDRLITAAQKNTALTPPQVRQGDRKSALVVALGDLYFMVEEWEKARLLYLLVHESAPGLAPAAAQRSWAAFMIARTYFWQFQFARAKEFYHVVFEQYPKAPWAATALYYNATMAYSNLRDMTEAVHCLDTIRKRYPRGEMAERATYLTGQLHQWKGQFGPAKEAYKHYLKRYPDGMYARGIRTMLLPELEQGKTGLEHNPKPK